MSTTSIARNKSNKNVCVFGTHEWAVKTANFIDGCYHDCKYCYSKSMAIRFKRKSTNTWKNETIRKNYSKSFKKIDGTIMYPSSHDIHPKHLNESIAFLYNILKPGNSVLIVTKPHFECVKAICDNFCEYKDNILFRFTIGSASSDILDFWEPGAPDFNERLKALRYSNSLGFKTSISCEPMLDNEIDKVIDKVYPYVTDSIWLGKANYLVKRMKLNGIRDQKILNKASQLLEWQSNENILRLYNKYKNVKKIKWKESIKGIVGIKIPIVKGLDI